MTTCDIKGVTVKFPFEPYAIQKNYMSKVIECLQSRSNGILESPTGTGKTLSLLCSSLAWLEAKKKEMQMERTACVDPDLFAKLNELNPNPKSMMKKIFGVPSIIYASRTHSQLSQAMTELKRTEYKYMKACVLGSRDQLCIDPEVVNEPNHNTKLHMCNLKVKTRTCRFHNGFEKKRENLSLFSEPVVDIEDLIREGKKQNFCPYYMSKEMNTNSDVIFMPYNYVIEPRYRKNLGVGLADNVVILDEAHNVEKLCQESASSQLRLLDVSLCVEDVTAAMKAIADGAEFADDSPKDFSAEDLCELKELLLKLEKAIDEIPLVNNEATFDGSYIFELLGKCQITIEHSPILISLLDRVSQFLSIGQGENSFQRRGIGLDNLEQFLSIVFVGSTASEAAYVERIKKCYKVHVKVDEAKKKDPKTFWSPQAKSGGKTVNYWCFNPGFGMNMLMSQGVHCVILTSGTLAPLPPLISELELNNIVHLENPHVIEEDQVFVRVITAGPDNEPLLCNYQNRSNQKYVVSLGITINNIVRVSPGGVLVFFPSYPLLTSFQDVWQSNGIWSGMNNVKTIYVEPKDKASFARTMTEYYSSIKSGNGAVFMGVCRGKISEGLDFADSNGRTVVIVGIPFPPLMDPRVLLKRSYMDASCSANREIPNGSKWYTLEALRAVNQAIGRVIRHSRDYGAIMLLDVRYKQPNLQEHLSKWLKNRIRIQNNFATINKDLRLFFQHADQKSFLPATPSTSSETLQSKKLVPVKRTIEVPHSAVVTKAKSPDEQGVKRKKITLLTNESKKAITVKAETADYIVMVKKALHPELFKMFVSYLQGYRDTKNFEEFVDNLDKIFVTRHHLRYLLQGVEYYMIESHREPFQAYLDKMKT